MESANGAVWYFGSKIKNLAENINFDGSIVIAPASSYAIEWAKSNGLSFVESANITHINFPNKISYEALGNEYTLTAKFVESLWDTSFVNTKKSCETVSHFDFNNDNTVNAKDFATSTGNKNAPTKSCRC